MNSAMPPTTKIRKNSRNPAEVMIAPPARPRWPSATPCPRSSYSSWFRKIRWTPAAASALSRSIACAGVPTMQSASISARYASNGPAAGSIPCARWRRSRYSASVRPMKNHVINEVDERVLIAPGGGDRRPRSTETLGDVGRRAADGVELIGVGADQSLHPRADGPTAQDQRRSRPLDRARQLVGVVEPIVLAVKRESILREQPVHDRNLLLEHLPAAIDVVEGESETCVLLLPPPGAHPDLDATVADEVDGERGPRQNSGLAERDRGDERAEPKGRGSRGERAERPSTRRWHRCRRRRSPLK